MDSKISDVVDLKRKLIKKRKDLQRKLELIKATQRNEEKKYEPLTKHLETLIERRSENPIKSNQDVKTKNVSNIEHSTPTKRKLENTILSPVREKKTIVTTPKQAEIFTPRQKRIATKVANLVKRIDAIKNEKEDRMSPISSKYDVLSQEDFEESINKTDAQDNVFQYIPEEDNDNYNFNEVLEKSVQLSKNYIKNIVDTDVYNEYLNDFDELPRKYIDEMHHDAESKFDHRTGVRHDTFSEKFYIGSKEVQFIGPDIKIDNEIFKGTPGIYELIFKKKPVHFTTEDKEIYKKILEKTNAYRRNFDENDRILGTSSMKYKNIIGPLFSTLTKYKKPKKGGQVLFKEVNTNKVDYVYWEDPNELVERLKLLVASQTAGHSGHQNEIVSIIEELREAKIIA